MRRKFYIILVLIIGQGILVAEAQQTAKITSSGIGYLEYLPDGYRSNSKKYPVVISLHGYKEAGTSSTDPKKVLADLPKVAYVGLPKYVTLGKKYPFILISPQLKGQYGTWPPSFIIQVLNDVKKTLRIDEKRIYLTGLSLGGLGVWKTAGEYPDIFAAIAPICSGGNALDKAREIAAANLPVWGFHGSSDQIVSFKVTTNMINAINASPKKPDPLAKVTIFPNMGHIIWDKAYNETNLLTWMLSHKKGGRASSQDNSNNHPVVNAGDDKTISLPTNSISFKAAASDEDGEVVSYSWTKSSGGTAILSGANTQQLKASDLKAGLYVFKITVKDNDGASSSDEVKVNVKASGNRLPVVNAGPDRTITLPTNSLKLQATATDADGEVISYEWTKTAGASVTLAGSNTPVLTASNLSSGSYEFRLTVKDNEGGVQSDVVVVTVRGSASENIPPVANAGSDMTLQLPAGTVYLKGSASDPDGSVASYRWTQLSGGTVTLRGTTTHTAMISDVNEGVYVFRLTVTDNKGATSNDDVTVHVFEESAENIIPADDIITPVQYTGPDRSKNVPLNMVYLKGKSWYKGQK